MSNKSEPHRKFVQTFVLAEQPNGYFVLNDIFRYLVDEEDEYVEEEQPANDVAAPKAEPEPEVAAEPAPQAETVKIEPPAAQEEVAEQVDAKLEEEIAKEPEEEVEEEETPAVNGNTEPEATEEEPASIEEPVEPEAVEPAAPAVEQPKEPEPTPAHSPPKATTPAPATEAPAAKKTWASLVGSKTAPTPVVPAPATAATPLAPKTTNKSTQPATPPSGPKEPAADLSSQSNGAGWQTAGDNNKKQARPQKAAQAGPEQKVLAYIKNVNEKVDASLLRETLEKFGPLKYFDVSRPRVSRYLLFNQDIH